MYEQELEVRLPIGSLTRAALTAGELTTIGGILISLDEGCEATSAIKTAYTEGGIDNVDDLLENFYNHESRRRQRNTVFPWNTCIRTTCL
ncbi:hypothetical protein [Natronococcus wangiae]|uniref:hypothetical protein n=1 Tax=Natronococcus wangiae TaxID=3068275 RepID=UPI00273F384E|nr:hypothetical protein [Natronococcus sp. AD5]